MTAFLVIGAVGLALLVAALVFGDFLDGMLPDVSLDSSGGLFSTEVVASFLTAFGFVAALLTWQTALSAGVAALGGLAAGVGVGAATLALTRSMMRMPTDATPRTSDLVGRLGVVVTRVPPGGLGEISVKHAGHRLKLSARADAPLAIGTEVIIVAVASPTSVVVTEADI